MRRLLAPDAAAVLESFARSRLLLAFDFDGTLAPIVADREAAAMRASTRRLLAEACARYPCAVISGRAVADVRARLEGVGVGFVVGNHGVEPGPTAEGCEADVRALVPWLRRALDGVDGVDLEDKRFSVALHYRDARRRRDARAAIERALAAAPVPVRQVGGKLVVNALPERAANKGDALFELRAKAGADAALYVGDDVTDEDVFAHDQPGRLLSVRVGASRASAAPYFLRDQREVDALLARLVALRERSEHASA